MKLLHFLLLSPPYLSSPVGTLLSLSLHGRFTASKVRLKMGTYNESSTSLNSMIDMQARNINDLEQERAKLITENEFLKAKCERLFESLQADREEEAYE